MFRRDTPDLEHFQARMPDGRLLFIERRRSLGFAPTLQGAISLMLIPGVLAFMLLFGPTIPIIVFAGLWSFVPVLFAVLAGAALVQDRLLNWMRNASVKPEHCKVVGMDCSTDELLAFARELSSKTPIQESVHQCPFASQNSPTAPLFE